MKIAHLCTTTQLLGKALDLANFFEILLGSLIRVCIHMEEVKLFTPNL